ncbi:MAG: hypothetical protein JNL90_12205 [Planctomycetes bacterium]|nr:hypothetical protein [Planctomycetota bacterium]
MKLQNLFTGFVASAALAVGALTLGASAAVAAAAAAPSAVENYPYQYDVFGTGLTFQPIDLAVSAPIGVNVNWLNHYLFVVDAATNELHRYTLDSTGDLVSQVPAVWFSDPNGTTRVTAVALDDNTTSPTFGYVYLATQDMNTSQWTLRTFDSTGTPGIWSQDPIGWKDIVALAVDKHGDVYVADAGLGTTFRYGVSQFANWISVQFISANAAFLPYNPIPADVTVTESDLVLVVDQSGTLMASNRNGTDFFNRSLGAPLIGSLSIDAHDQSERLWALDPPGPAVSQFADRFFFPSCYAGNGFGNSVDGQTDPSGPGFLSAPVRVEFARFFDKLPTVTAPRCSERVFVADPKGSRVVSFLVQQVARQPSPKPDAWWRFDELGATVLDSSGNNNTGFFTPWIPAAREEGMVKNGLVFDDFGDGVRVPSSPSLNVGTGSFTLECWVRTCDTRAVRDIVDKRVFSGPTALAGYHLYLFNGYLSFQIAANNTWWNVGTAPSPAGFVADGLFHHLAVVVDRDASSPNFNKLLFFVDGAQVGLPIAISPAVLGNLNNSRPLLIGRHPTYGESGSLKGEIDEVTLFKQALNGAQIQKIFQDRGAGKP